MLGRHRLPPHPHPQSPLQPLTRRPTLPTLLLPHGPRTVTMPPRSSSPTRPPHPVAHPFRGEAFQNPTTQPISVPLPPPQGEFHQPPSSRRNSSGLKGLSYNIRSHASISSPLPELRSPTTPTGALTPGPTPRRSSFRRRGFRSATSVAPRAARKNWLRSLRSPLQSQTPRQSL